MSPPAARPSRSLRSSVSPVAAIVPPKGLTSAAELSTKERTDRKAPRSRSGRGASGRSDGGTSCSRPVGDAMARVIFEHVTKRYGGNPVPAVKDLNMEVFDREFLVLVGPSGCGKTTAMRMVAGLEEISEGRIIIGDRVVNNRKSTRLN